MNKNDSTPFSLSKMQNIIKENPMAYVVTVEAVAVDDMLPQDLCTQIINKYAIKNKVSPESATVGISCLIQMGGTNLSKKTLTRTIGDVTYDINDLRAIIKEVDKTGTVRKFAKGIRDIVVDIASLNKWAGPLRNDLRTKNPNLDITEDMGPWCLEVHSDNPSCPQGIKEALIRREEQLKLLQQESIKTPKSRKQRGKGKKNNK
jgi:hypothetical protein